MSRELNIIGDAWRERERGNKKKETVNHVGGTIACSHGKSTRSTSNTWYSHAEPKVLLIKTNYDLWFMIALIDCFLLYLALS